jgi:hypothetical protein
MLFRHIISILGPSEWFHMLDNLGCVLRLFSFPFVADADAKAKCEAEVKIKAQGLADALL